MTAYYNEHDGFKAEWLRHLIAKGVIAKGEVDERDIRKVQPGDLAGFSQCHFFAGVGVWSYALRLAGWPDDRPVWTGSCPCPGFSAAGKGGGFSDPRHLWPDWFRLVRERRPANLFGEQADDAVGFGWLDLVQTDLEAADYAVGKAVFGACSVGAPHIRQRLYFGAHAHGAELFRESSAGHESPDRRNGEAIHDGANAANSNWRGAGRTGDEGRRPAQAGGPRSEVCANSDSNSVQPEQFARARPRPDEAEGRRPRSEPAGPGNAPGARRREEGRAASESGPLGGFWRDAIWLPCRDGKYRPTQPGLFPLAHGASARVGRLRGYGDAIVAQQAQAFIEAFIGAVQP